MRKTSDTTIPVYARPDALRTTINALKNNSLASESALFVFSDAPGHPEHAAVIRQVRDYLHTVTGFRYVFVIEREKNFGPLGNISDAVDRILDRYDRCIVLEEDIVTSPYFLQYMNDALVAYRDNPHVMGIASYKPPFPDRDRDGVSSCTASVHGETPFGSSGGEPCCGTMPRNCWKNCTNENCWPSSTAIPVSSYPPPEC